MVIATPAIQRLHEGLTDARIDLLTTNWTAPAAVGNPCIDNMITANSNVFFSPSIGSIIPAIQLIRLIRQRRYDAAVLFHSHPVIERFILLTGIKKRFCFDGMNNSRSIHLDEKRHSAITAWELADLTVRSLGGKEAEYPFLENLRYSWYIDKSDSEKADIILQKTGLKGKDFVAVFPGGGVNPNSSENVRRWAQEKYAELVQNIIKESALKVVLMGSETDLEPTLFITREAGIGVVNLCGKQDIRTTAAIMKKSKLVISNDSGPMHIAAAIGTPVVGIFGPTGVKLKLPPGEKSFSVSLGLPCSPCYFSAFKACIFDRIRCMDELTVDKVMEAVRRALDAK
ncbi:glycosyltransferase family 9 protein [bacterium]|nr:glycosyltransferase family 9 protein [bacterium]